MVLELHYVVLELRCVVLELRYVVLFKFGYVVL